MRARVLLLWPAVTGAAILVFFRFTRSIARHGTTDFELEAKNAVLALRDGDIGSFLEQCPAYCGSLILRAPLALLPGLDTGDRLFVAMSSAGVIAAVWLGVAVWERSSRVSGRRAAWVALGIACVNPLLGRAFRTGHPEEVMATALVVAAAFAAGRGRGPLAGILVGLAVATKLWAVVAVLPVVLILRHGRWPAIAVAAVTATIVLAPILLHGGGGLTTASKISADTGAIFEPSQVWWFTGDDDGTVLDAFHRPREDFRSPPEWVTRIARPLAVAVPVALCLLLWRRMRDRPWTHGLLLLALALLLRCLLDPWNTQYYELAFLMALLAWEVCARPGLPWRSLAVAVLTYLSLVELDGRLHPDLQSALFLAWSVPLAAAMLVIVLRPGAGDRSPHDHRRGGGAIAAAADREGHGTAPARA